MTTNPFVTVQSNLASGCMPNPVLTCIRSTTVGIKDNTNPGALPDKITYGYWGDTGYDTIYVLNAGAATPNIYTGAQVAALEAAGTPLTTSRGGVVTYDASTARVSVTQILGVFAADGTHSQWTVTMGAYYLVIALPIGEGFYQSKGLCGWFNADPNDDFTDSDGNTFVPNTLNGVRYNGNDVNIWGTKYAVTTGGPIAPLADFHYHNHPLTNEIYVGETTPTPSVPDAFNQSMIEKLNITLDQLSAIEAQCDQLTNDTNAYENCIYDLATGADTRLAQSNLFAAATRDAYNPTSDTVLSEGEIAGIVLGSFAGVACILAVGTYVKLHQAKKDYNKLIVSNRASGASGRGGQTAAMPSL